MKYCCLSEEYLVKIISYNEGDITDKVKRNPHDTSSGFGAKQFRGEQQFRNSDKYFSLKEKIVIMFKKVINTILLRFGPKSKLAANKLAIRNKIEQIKKTSNTFDGISIKKRYVLITRPTVDIQQSFNEILNPFKSILSNPDNYADTEENKNAEWKNTGYIGEIGGAHRALSSITSLMCSNLKFNPNEKEYEKRYTNKTNYNVVRKDNKSEMEKNASDNFIFELYDDKDNYDNYVVSIGKENMIFNNANEVIKFMNDRLLAIDNIMKQINIGNKQLQILRDRVSENVKTNTAMKKVQYLITEYNYFIKGLNIICNRFLADCIDLANSTIKTAEFSANIESFNIAII